MNKTTSSANELPLWDLNDLYNNHKSEELAADLVSIEASIKDFSDKYEGNVAKLEAADMHRAIAQYEEIDELMGRIASYAYLLYSTHLNDNEVLGFFQNTSEAINALSGKLLFFPLELNLIDDVKLQQFMLHEGAARYLPWIEKLRALKPYQLAEKEEKVLHEKSITSNEYWVKLFDKSMAALRFPFQGEELPYAQIAQKLFSHEESVRKEAGFAITSILQNNIELFSLITNALAKDKAIDDGLRNVPSVTTLRNISNQVEDEVVEALSKAVQANYANLAQRYYSLKAKWLGKEKLEFWDRNAPLPFSSSENISWEQARDIVLSAYGSFSEDFAILAKMFFDNNWIDARVYEGKDYGAYSHPTVPSAHPYILMNYQGKRDDVMTLAHELGHGVHQLLAADVGHLMSSTPLILAETASIFGEQLVFEHLMLMETNPQMRKAMLAKKVEDSLNTVVRQIAFYEFELKVHNGRKQGELTSQQISEIWGGINKKCFGNSVNFREESISLWASIPHFIHSPFYVYAYAFGSCLVNSLYGVYKKDEVQDFLPKYLDLLKAGGSKKHSELLAPFGLNALDPDFWQKGLDVISSMIDELIELDEVTS